MALNNDQYFATLSGEELGQALQEKIDAYYNYISTQNNLFLLWRKSFYSYYKAVPTVGSINKTGTQGEYSSVCVNHYRSILDRILSMTEASEPSFDPQAINSDYKSQAQAIVARDVLDYFYREKKMSENITIALRQALMYGESFVTAEWDDLIGESLMTDEQGFPVKSGDLVFSNYNPMDVIRDFNANSAAQNQWYIFRSYRNKADLIAKYPEMEQQIKDASSPSYSNFQTSTFTKYTTEDSDMITFFTFYHKRTPAVPDGKMTYFLSSDCVLLECPLPYESVPAYRVAPQEQEYSPFGNTIAFDLLPIQDMINDLESTIITNQRTFGVQNVLLPNGANINAKSLFGGLNVITYDAEKNQKPEALNLTATAVEVFNHLKDKVQDMETISGVNSVARGNPEASLKSGAALALVQSMALQSNNGFQQSYKQLLEDLGTGVVDILKKFAKAPRLISIVGKTKQAYLQEFTGQDIVSVNRVLVNMGNPLTRTLAGKVNLAEVYMQNELIKTPSEYIQVVETGNLDPLIEGEQAELMGIKAENEELAQGRPVQAMMTDDHITHIKEHKAVGANIEARQNPAIIQALNAHIQEHIDLLQTMNPILAQILGQPAVQLPPPVAPGAGAALGPAPSGVEGVNLPNMPTNPLTGEKVNPDGTQPNNGTLPNDGGVLSNV